MQGQVWQEHQHDTHRAPPQVVQGLALQLHGHLVGLRCGQHLLEGDADVAIGQVLAEPLAAIMATVGAAHQHDDPALAEGQHELYHDLNLVTGPWHCVQERWKAQPVTQLIIDGTVGDLLEGRGCQHQQGAHGQAPQGVPPAIIILVTSGEHTVPAMPLAA